MSQQTRPARVQSGVPAGGQFATTARPEADVTLAVRPSASAGDAPAPAPSGRAGIYRRPSWLAKDGDRYSTEDGYWADKVSDERDGRMHTSYVVHSPDGAHGQVTRVADMVEWIETHREHGSAPSQQPTQQPTQQQGRSGRPAYYALAEEWENDRVNNPDGWLVDPEALLAIEESAWDSDTPPSQEALVEAYRRAWRYQSERFKKTGSKHDAAQMVAIEREVARKFGPGA